MSTRSGHRAATTNTPEELTIEQRHRDAAANLAEWLTAAQEEWDGMTVWFAADAPRAFREGAFDNHEFVQAFARFESQHMPCIPEDVREALDDARSTLLYIFETTDDEVTAKAAKSAFDKAEATLLHQPEQGREGIAVPVELRKMSERATAGPWCWEQCGDKQDDPVVGIAFPPDDENGEHAYSGRLTDDDAYRYGRIAIEWPHCDGHSGSANAAFAVAAVNFVRALIAAAPVDGEGL